MSRGLCTASALLGAALWADPVRAQTSTAPSSEIVGRQSSTVSHQSPIRQSPISSIATRQSSVVNRQWAEGWELYQRGDIEGASTALAAAAQEEAAPAWVHYALGLAEFALGKPESAARAWERVRRMSPEFRAVYFDLTDSYLQLHRLDDAIAILRAGVARWPGDAEVWNAMGVVQGRRGTFDAAVESFERAVHAAPNEVLGHFNLARMLEMRFVQSRRLLRASRIWLANQNDRRRAGEHYARALEIGGPFDAAAREGLARLEGTLRK